MSYLTQELSEICGIHAGDGYLRKRNNKIELDITGNLEEKEYYDKHVILLINKFFGLNLGAKAYSKGTYGFVATNPKFKILNELGFPFGKKSNIVEVPKAILEKRDKSFYVRFLRGLFDTDGHLGFRKCYGKYKLFKTKNHHYPFITLTTISKNFANQIKFMLDFLGIGNFLHYSSSKKENENAVYRIFINGVERLNKWMELIGSRNPVKSSRYFVWKKFGFCPTNLSLEQRKDILRGNLDINSIGS